MWPQIIMIILFTIVLSANLFLHGEPKTGYHSFWMALFSVLLYVVLLYWGGFFDCFFK